MLYNSFQNRIIIRGEIEAIDPIHIGASAKESLNPVDLDAHVLKDAAGNPVIPGSSIKGVVRSRFEAILRTLSVPVCDIFNKSDETCTSQAFITKIQKDKGKTDAEKAQDLYNRSCTVCQLFGGRAIAGKLRFKDCSYIGEKCAYENRDGVGIDRDTGAAKRGAKYNFEIIPKGSRFDFMLIAENLDEAQKPYLNFILDMLEGKGITEGDYIAIGGKTTRGMGRIRLAINRTDDIEEISAKKMLTTVKEKLEKYNIEEQKKMGRC